MKKILIGLVVLVAVEAMRGLLTRRNSKMPGRPPDLYYEYYKVHDTTTPEGKVGVFLVGLDTAADFEPRVVERIFLTTCCMPLFRGPGGFLPAWTRAWC